MSGWVGMTSTAMPSIRQRQGCTLGGIGLKSETHGLRPQNTGHRTTKVRPPRTNGFVERMNRTLLDECFRVAGRTTRDLSPAEIQRDLDRSLASYKFERSHQGYRLRGRTPAAALVDALRESAHPLLDAAPEELATLN